MKLRFDETVLLSKILEHLSSIALKLFMNKLLVKEIKFKT